MPQPSWLQSDLDIRKSILDNQMIAQESEFSQTMQDRRDKLTELQ